MKLQTRRLTLRPWREEDAADLYELARDERVGRGADWPPHRSVEESREVIRTVFAVEEIYALELRSTGRIVGCIGLLRGGVSHLDLPDDQAEVGYWIGVPHWGQGLTAEALEELIRHAFDHLRLTALWCCSFTDNAASRRVWEKCGFSYVRTEAGSAKIGGAGGAAMELSGAEIGGADRATTGRTADSAAAADRTADPTAGRSAGWRRAVHIARLVPRTASDQYLAVRRADESDIALIRRLADEAFPATYREILTPAQLDYMMEWMYSPESLARQLREGHVYFIASADGEPCGYASVRQEGHDLFHLEKIYVLPRFQGIGAGALLFRTVVEHVRTVHPLPCRLELNVNRRNRAVRFYERMGMRRLREGDFPIGEGFYMNDYIMGLEIA